MKYIIIGRFSNVARIQLKNMKKYIIAFVVAAFWSAVVGATPQAQFDKDEFQWVTRMVDMNIDASQPASTNMSHRPY